MYIVRGLRVDAPRMRENLDRLGGLVLSEAVMLRLGATLGRNAAHDIVYETAMAAVDGRAAFRDLLLGDPRVAAALKATELDRLLDPAGYVGLAGTFVDRVLAQARTVTG